MAILSTLKLSSFKQTSIYQVLIRLKTLIIHTAHAKFNLVNKFSVDKS